MNIWNFWVCITSKSYLQPDITLCICLTRLRRHREILMQLLSLHSTKAKIAGIEDLTIGLAYATVNSQKYITHCIYSLQEGIP